MPKIAHLALRTIAEGYLKYSSFIANLIKDSFWVVSSKNISTVILFLAGQSSSKNCATSFRKFVDQKLDDFHCLHWAFWTGFAVNVWSLFQKCGLFLNNFELNLVLGKQYCTTRAFQHSSEVDWSVQIWHAFGIGWTRSQFGFKMANYSRNFWQTFPVENCLQAAFSSNFHYTFEQFDCFAVAWVHCYHSTKWRLKRTSKTQAAYSKPQNRLVKSIVFENPGNVSRFLKNFNFLFYNNFRRKKRSKNARAKKHYCHYCELSLVNNSEEARRFHNNGRKHKRNMDRFYGNFIALSFSGDYNI